MKTAGKSALWLDRAGDAGSVLRTHATAGAEEKFGPLQVKKPLATGIGLNGYRKKLLSDLLTMHLFLLQQQFPAQFFNCAAEPEPLENIKQVTCQDTHKKRYDYNAPQGECI